MYVRNAWYMAGWARDFAVGKPHAETILGEPIVLWRRDDGRMAALEDRCVHRLAPLSLGRCEGDAIRCMYHGLLFAPDGAVREIPGQDVIPKQARARAYPVEEHASAVWLWMGDPAVADTALLPDFVGIDDPRFAMEPGRLDYDAPAKLIHDNLLDLSHLAYVHANSFVGGKEDVGASWLGAKLATRTLERGVEVERWVRDSPMNPARGAGANDTVIDVWSCYQFLVPGIFIQRTERHPQGSFDRWQGGRPQEEPLFVTFTCQAVTPLTDETACYFFAYGPWAAAAVQKDFFAQLGRKAFNEDKVMIEAQHRMIGQSPGARMMPFVMDKSVLAYEGVVKKLLQAEAREPETEPA